MATKSKYTCDTCKKDMILPENKTFYKNIYFSDQKLSFKFEFLGIVEENIITDKKDLCELCKLRAFLSVTKILAEGLDKELAGLWTAT